MITEPFCESKTSFFDVRCFKTGASDCVIDTDRRAALASFGCTNLFGWIDSERSSREFACRVSRVLPGIVSGLLLFRVCCDERKLYVLKISNPPVNANGSGLKDIVCPGIVSWKTF